MSEQLVSRLKDLKNKLEASLGESKVLIVELNSQKPPSPEPQNTGVQPKHIEKDGIIYFSVVSNGLTGEEWISRLESRGDRVAPYAKSILLSEDFKPTNGVKTEVAVLKGELFTDENRIMKKIRAEALKRKFIKPNAEVACLIREKFTDAEIKAMGLHWIIVMHQPIDDSGGDLSLLSVYRYDHGRWLHACCDGSADRWDRSSGFAFSLSQVP